MLRHCLLQVVSKALGRQLAKTTQHAMCFSDFFLYTSCTRWLWPMTILGLTNAETVLALKGRAWIEEFYCSKLNFTAAVTHRQNKLSKHVFFHLNTCENLNYYQELQNRAAMQNALQSRIVGKTSPSLGIFCRLPRLCCSSHTSNPVIRVGTDVTFLYTENTKHASGPAERHKHRW